MKEPVNRSFAGWFERKRYERGQRAIERQREYQEAKAAALQGDKHGLSHSGFLHSQSVRRKLANVAPIADDAKVLEVGSGAHGLIFGFGCRNGVGIDPLAVDYKRLFPAVQQQALTVAAIGEELPFGDSSFDIVLSDNVIDHAERPLVIVDEIIRVLKPGGVLYFTVNIHHPIYDVVSRAHGAWNALGVKLEHSAFADHTVHLTEQAISRVFQDKPLQIIEQRSNIDETKAAFRNAKLSLDPDALLKKLFFKNALFELIARKE